MVPEIRERWKRQVARLKGETYALYLAYQDPRTPWYAKVFAACVVGYALSPIDLIPDPIPVLGYLDDLVLVPLGVFLALKMIPPGVLDDCREKARLRMDGGGPPNRAAAAVIISLWILTVAAILYTTARLVLR